VADTLGGLPVEEGATLTAGTVQVYLGRDYPGPPKPRIAGASFLRVDESSAPSTVRLVAGTARADVPCVS
jgi:hypothetical protein